MYKNMKDLGMNFNVPPEFIEANAITVDEALAMSYNGGIVSYNKSILFPENMYNEWFSYATTGIF
jgi:hypothetical protein